MYTIIKTKKGKSCLEIIFNFEHTIDPKALQCMLSTVNSQTAVGCGSMEAAIHLILPTRPSQTYIVPIFLFSFMI